MSVLFPGKNKAPIASKYDIVSCPSCNALVWNAEAVGNETQKAPRKFSICCQQGRVKLPPVREPPSPLKELLETPSFRLQIRIANGMLAFTSMGANIDRTVTGTPGTFTFRINGQIIHRIGSLLPEDGNEPQFLQLYIVDTANEVQNRKKAITGGSSEISIPDCSVDKYGG